MALNTDYALRTGAFDPIKGQTLDTLNQDALKKQALQRYQELKVWMIVWLQPLLGTGLWK